MFFISVQRLGDMSPMRLLEGLHSLGKLCSSNYQFLSFITHVYDISGFLPLDSLNPSLLMCVQEVVDLVFRVLQCVLTPTLLQ